MNISVIIVNYFTSSFLPPLLKVLNNEPDIKEIIVADNSAEPGLAEAIKRFYIVRSIVFSENIGFAAAVNRAVENCNSDWFLIINPDTLPNKGFLRKLISGAEKSNALIAGPKFFWDNEKKYKLPPALGNSWWMQTGMEAANKFKLDARILQFYWDLRFDRFWKETEPFYEPFLSGACLLIKNDKTFFKDSKVFDERFFLYYEDTDLCASAMTNNQIMVCVPDAYVVHYWNQSPSMDKERLMMESHHKFMQKNYPGLKHQILNSDESENNFVDLGNVDKSPQFDFETKHNLQNLKFELGVGPTFIPFIQTDVNNLPFVISTEVWENIKPGIYFCRIRDEQNISLKTWRWKKYCDLKGAF